jgi:lipopolysaccharide heptosyltransferase II
MPIGTEGPGISKNLTSKSADAAALGVLVKMSARKRFLIRVAEFIARPFVATSECFHQRPKNSAGEIKKILVMEYWNLGDIVMLSPFLRSLRIQYPNASISLLASPKAAPLLEHQGLVDDVIVVCVPWAQHYSRWRKYNPFSRLWLNLLRTLSLLHKQQFDLAFTVRADIRDNFILWLSKSRRRVGYGFAGGAFFLTDNVTPDLEHPHLSVRWLRLLEHLGDFALVRQPSLQITKEEDQQAEQYLAALGVREGDFLVGIHPGARNAMRQWGDANFAAIAQRLQSQFVIKVLWFQDPNQKSEGLDEGQVLPLALPLRQFMGVLKRCRLLICNDSGPMHIATALGIPVVAIFGPTEPAWFGPLGPNNRVVIQSGFWCRPCFDYCRFDEPYCMRVITVNSVYAAAEEALNALMQNAKDGEITQGSSIGSTIISIAQTV